MPPALPRWEPEARALLAAASRRITLIGALTPTNLARELGALSRDWGRGNERAPRFRYGDQRPAEPLQRALDRADRALRRRGPLGRLYAARARELATELALCTARQPARFATLASRRFPRRDHFDEEADRLAAAWRSAPAPRGERGVLPSDDQADPRSLLRQLHAETSRLGLAMAVRPADGLAALAATGDGGIYVSRGRRLSPSDVRRTVLHEVHGHALPRQRGRRARLGLFEVGTAFGTDDQEGRALLLEQEAGLLVGPRRLELSLRHQAARSAAAGASFVETTRALAHPAVGLADRLRIAARAHRGAGLGRERVYLPALLRVRELRRSDPGLDAVLAGGTISVDAAAELRAWLG